MKPHASKNIDEISAAARQHSGEDARVPAVETTALLATDLSIECFPIERLLPPAFFAG